MSETDPLRDAVVAMNLDLTCEEKPPLDEPCGECPVCRLRAVLEGGR